MAWGYLRCATAATATLLATGAYGQANSGVVEQIRVSADGAEPSHIFWIGSRSGGSERIGIVDPLFAAMRIFDVERRTLAKPKLHERLTSVGVCSLPVSFRPWRLHQLARTVVLESMPLPGPAMQNAIAATLRSDQYTVDRARLLADDGGAFASAAATIVDAAWDPSKAPACGVLTKSAATIGAGLPEHAERGHNNPRRTIWLANGPGALAPAPRLVVRSPNGQAFRLISARELEPTATTRIVQTTEGISADDGIFRVTQRPVSYSRANGQPLATLQFNDRFVRSKIGLRPVMVLPDGEVLAMGKYVKEDASAFRLVSCGSLGEKASSGSGLCVEDEGAVEAIATPDLKVVEQAQQPDQATAGEAVQTGARLSSRIIFGNVAPLVNFRMSVDSTAMPEQCRAPGGCFTGQHDEHGKALNFVPIKDVRLTRGKFARDGVPYAQADLPGDLDTIMSSTFEQRTRTLAGVMTAKSGIPGNLMDGFTGDMGIDCSGLVQVAWGAWRRPLLAVKGSDRLGRDRLSTDAMQNFSDGLLCKARLPSADWLMPGDAIDLNVTHTTNHVMLYAATIQVDGASDAWLMLEAASGCDGVCWSIYDPSFFNGWGLYRAIGRSDAPCPRKLNRNSAAIPQSSEAWSAMADATPALVRASVPRRGR